MNKQIPHPIAEVAIIKQVMVEFGFAVFLLALGQRSLSKSCRAWNVSLHGFNGIYYTKNLSRYYMLQHFFHQEVFPCVSLKNSSWGPVAWPSG